MNVWVLGRTMNFHRISAVIDLGRLAFTDVVLAQTCHWTWRTLKETRSSFPAGNMTTLATATRRILGRITLPPPGGESPRMRCNPNRPEAWFDLFDLLNSEPPPCEQRRCDSWRFYQTGRARLFERLVNDIKTWSPNDVRLGNWVDILARSVHLLSQSREGSPQLSRKWCGTNGRKHQRHSQAKGS